MRRLTRTVGAIVAATALVSIVAAAPASAAATHAQPDGPGYCCVD